MKKIVPSIIVITMIMIATLFIITVKLTPEEILMWIISCIILAILGLALAIGSENRKIDERNFNSAYRRDIARYNARKRKA